MISGEESTDLALSAGAVIEVLGFKGVIVLLAVGTLLVKSKVARKALRSAMKRVAYYVTVTLWGARLGIGPRLAHRLQPKRWRAMCEDRKLVGLKRGKVKRTPQGIAVHVTFNKTMTLEYVVSRITALETGLGIKSGSVRIDRGTSASRGVVHIMVRDPLAKGVQWEAPAGDVSVRDALRVAMTAFGEWLEINLCQRILVIGASGSGKSSIQRVLAAFIALAVDADLEVWDLKYGTESQHYESLADHRVTTTEGCSERIAWYKDVELPRRAAEMKRLGVSEYPISATNPARFLLVDEGSELIRKLSPEELRAFFTVMEMGRALGVFIIWATQFPKASNLPTELRSQFSAVIALLMKRASESRIVFEEDVKEGWTPHSLRGKGWLLLQDEDNSEPFPARAPWITTDEFKAIKATPTLPPHVPVISLHKAPKAPPVHHEETLTNYDLALREFRLAGENGLPVIRIMQVTGLAKSQAYSLVNRLINDGHVYQLKQGRYALKTRESVPA